MSFSAGQLDALENAIASGAMSVSFEGKSTSFRSVDDMLRKRHNPACAWARACYVCDGLGGS
jgi:hypothetical protein